MTASRIGRACRVGVHLVLIPMFLTMAAIVGWTAGDYHWPYVVVSVDVEPEPARPGGVVTVTTTRHFLDDCDLEFERQLESVRHAAHGSVPLPFERTRTPWPLNDQPDPRQFAIPASFPCGPAQVRTTPSASCNWMQVGWLRQRKNAVVTPFEVQCEP